MLIRLVHKATGLSIEHSNISKRRCLNCTVLKKKTNPNIAMMSSFTKSAAIYNIKRPHTIYQTISRARTNRGGVKVTSIATSHS